MFEAYYKKTTFDVVVRDTDDGRMTKENGKLFEVLSYLEKNCINVY